jgi:hypothetical protein
MYFIWNFSIFIEKPFLFVFVQYFIMYNFNVGNLLSIY